MSTPIHASRGCRCELTALIVDDDRGVRALLRRIVERSGWTVHEAANTAQARQALSTGTYQIVFMDEEMPDGKGLDVLAWWRAQGHDEAVPAFVTVTSLNSVEFAERARQLGARDCLNKPVSVYEIRCRLDQFAGEATQSSCRTATSQSAPARVASPRGPRSRNPVHPIRRVANGHRV